MPPSTLQLRIDPEFKRLIPPITPGEYDQLRENLIRDGCLHPICAWNDIILDGHNRYEICTLANIPFSIHSLKFVRREAAIAWICANQIKRRGIAEEMRRYLIGKRYEAEKIIAASNANGTDQHSSEGTCQIDAQPPRRGYGQIIALALGTEYMLSYSTILRYGWYAKDVDCIAERADGLAPKLLGGQIEIPMDAVHQLAQMTEQQYAHACRYITNGRYETLAYFESRKLLSGDIKRHIQRRESVKDMPIYDPDAELASLILTIPSWRDSLNRVREQMNVCATSPQVRLQLLDELHQLYNANRRMQRAIRGGQVV